MYLSAPVSKQQAQQPHIAGILPGNWQLAEWGT
jgi:hypothetical protein